MNSFNDSPEKISPVDPRLTAYAFGELEGDDFIQLEAAVQADPGLQAAVAELRALGGQLADTLTHEPFGDPVEAPTDSAFPALGSASTSGFGGGGGFLAKFYYLAGGLAAAGVAVLVAVRTGDDASAKTNQGARVMELVSAPAEGVSLAVKSTAVAVDTEARKAAPTGVRFQSRPPAVAPDKPAFGFRAAAPEPKAAEPYIQPHAAPLGDGFHPVATEPLSTFSIEVGTASYRNVRRLIRDGRVPSADVVRIEELVNYFPYRHLQSRADINKTAPPFSAQLEVFSAPWTPAHRLVRIGIKTREPAAADPVGDGLEGSPGTLAKGVKIRVEFNPARVASYRLIGYEDRRLAKESMNRDAVSGEVGAGHAVTVLYEIVPVRSGDDDGGPSRPLVDALKYQNAESTPSRMTAANPVEMLTVNIRYKAPGDEVSKTQEFPLIETGADFSEARGDFQFTAAVAAWGMLLRDSPHKGSATFAQVIEWAERGLADDEGGYRADFIQLVRQSRQLLSR